MKKLRLIIIEDEDAARRHLKKIVHDINPETSILAEIDSIKSGLDFFAAFHGEADGILADIELADGKCFGIFKHFPPSCPVIFTTAYDEFALQAFQNNGIDYLLKPLQMKAVEKALNKLPALNTSFDWTQIIKEIQAKPTYQENFLFRNGTRLFPVKADHILYFKAADKMVFGMTTDQKKYILDESLDELEKKINPLRFFRINRQLLAHRESILQIHTWPQGRLKLHIKYLIEDDIVVSRERSHDLKKWLTKENDV